MPMMNRLFAGPPVSYTHLDVYKRQVLGSAMLTVGAVDEIELSEGFFSYEEKYTLKTSRIHCPARIPAEKAAEIQAVAKRIYRALDCRVFARVDLFLTPAGEIVFNEVNTIPGFTVHSRYPNMMRQAGVDFGDLLHLSLIHISWA